MSRRLFYILLAANLILPLWGTLGLRVPGNGTSLPGDPVVARLVLLAERSEPLVPETKAVNHPVAPRTPSGIAARPASRGECCRCVGLFEDQAPARNFAAQLHRLGIDVEVETAMATTVIGYWLMYPAANMTQAQENLRRLQALGFTDLWLFRRGAWRNAISVGLYSQLSRAGAVADRLRARGIDVAVLPRHRKVAVFWVRMRREPFPGWLASLTPGLNGRDCPHLGELAVSIPSEAALLADEVAVSPRL